MDHHGFLTVFRAVAASAQQVQANTTTRTWSWVGTPVIYPESRCPFCRHVVRSPGIWLLANGNYLKNDKLVGALFPTRGGKIKLVMPSHPHDTGGGYLCLGRNADGVALLASTPNIDDSPMGKFMIPRWLAMYWNHKCKEMVKYLKLYGEDERIRELEKL